MRKETPQFFRLALAAFIGILVIGCSLPFGGGGSALATSTSAPINPPPTNALPPTAAPPTVAPPTQAPPTQAPPPTQQPSLTSQPKASPTVEALDFFTEEFDTTLPDWTLFYTSGDEDLADVYTEDGRLKFYLNGEYIWAYVVYNPYYYSDVMLTAVVENRGYNNNNVSLICRYDPDVGWYEFNIANNGLYWIYYYNVRDNSYNQVHDGGSGSIHTGKAVNEYTAVCKADKLILYINGTETARITELKYALKEGLVGISVSSFDIIPIDVEVESFTISLP